VDGEEGVDLMMKSFKSLWNKLLKARVDNIYLALGRSHDTDFYEWMGPWCLTAGRYWRWNFQKQENLNS
jgi:hypothetical protein